jgi:hypothetical protein
MEAGVMPEDAPKDTPTISLKTKTAKLHELFSFVSKTVIKHSFTRHLGAHH